MAGGWMVWLRRVTHALNRVFILLAGVHGRTMGQVVCGVPDRRPECPLRLRVILLRAVNAWAPAD